ncbi:chondroitinase B-like protein [Kineococcus xinjiangensis]|uniref:Chondroitinase B-like protein n=1 Tax=Kineococcus xinjiangensis TaxID=512762 RepID=A0A2S6ICM3_9ACTN|nr:right-handed parallel beta-helix repeat-containing protein [Kineococcus xinjiangensis]PPK91972.1 chondroitinase B-like protein [Kineococcus xinjiangensis]
MRPSLRIASLALVAASCLPLVPTAAAATTAPAVLYGGATLGGTVVAGGLVDVVAPGAVRVKFYLDGDYRAVDVTAPFQWKLSAPAGSHVLRIRSYDAQRNSTTTEVRFTVGSTAIAPAPTPTPTPTPTPVAPAPAPAPVDGASSRTVRTVEEIRNAVATAKPGDVITVADGEYTIRPRLVVSANGTAAAPITLRGSRAAVIRSTSTGGDYGMHVTGDHWRIEGLTVAHATKGIVLDQSVGTVIDRVEVHDIGHEGVHFRWCSSDGKLINSYVHDTGRTNAGYGEGVYVGSANSNWSKYACVDGRDNSERVLIENNVFRNIAAEGADLKEGTESGTLRGNLFDNVGFSGANSADSAVDAKGNGWLIERNTVRNGTGSFLDGYQTHSVYTGYGVGNVFRGNTVEGRVPGWGFGIYPARSNTVACDNSAPQAAKGLASVPCS